ncbi:MAG: hypothetical protein AAB696_01915 [Patescibacteria group bacterium]
MIEGYPNNEKEGDENAIKSKVSSFKESLEILEGRLGGENKNTIIAIEAQIRNKQEEIRELEEKLEEMKSGHA